MPVTPSYRGFAPTSPLASRIKRANRRVGGRAEHLLGQAMWRLGLRYRKHLSTLPGKPDFVFAGARTCVFCDGDFWHGRNWERLRLQLARRANADYWIAKIARNRERDLEQIAALEARGWKVFRLWETDVLRNPEQLAAQIALVVRDHRRLSRVGSRAKSISQTLRLTVTLSSVT